MRGGRLSELARHVTIPEGIVSTGWGQAEVQLARMEYPLDRWQQGLGTLLLAKRADGLYACGVGGAVLSIPRQVGKTYTIAGIIFALCVANPDTLVIWSAHRVKTHMETFGSMAGVARKAGVAPFVESVKRGAGQEAVVFKNGSRVLFGARENGFGRGFAKVDVLVLDEAQILSEKAMEDMVPATNAAPNGLVVMMGTPPRPSDPGEVFSARRDDALAGDPDTLYVEFSADEGADPDDEGQWRKANPSFPVRTTRAAILRMRKMLGSDDSFRREGLGIWDSESAEYAFSRSQWDSLVGEPPSDGVASFGVKFSSDGSSVALGACMKSGDSYFVEGIREVSLDNGVQWLVDFLVERKDTMAQVVIDGRSGVGYLVDALRAERVGKPVIMVPSVEQAVTAHTLFDQAVKQGDLVHSGQPELGEQVRFAVRRKIGNLGAFGWESSREGGSVGFVDACTLAHWGSHVTKRHPGRKQVFG